ncbi:MAG: M20/M25/M40 family metallo-hydrolase [Oscillospiraceae bacterium]|nr:M20/M25/M40 family metallo-hydrolase [Oscillospiraceae bacterium]
MNLKDTVMALSSLNGPSGWEHSVTSWLQERVKPYCDSAHTDVMGNLVAVQKCGNENAKKILLDAHIDEIGLIVTGIEKGFLRFASIGGVDARILPAMQVKVLTEPPIRGIIDSMPPHALSAEDMEKPFAMEKLTIDIAMTQEEAESAVPLGTPVVFDVEPVMMGEHQLCGKALDDRACAAIICKVMEQLKEQAVDADIYYLFSSQEELGARGAAPAVFDIVPDYAIVLDVTHAKTPDAKGLELTDMGKGPAVAIGPNMTYSMTKGLQETANALDMSYQMEVIRGNSGTNAWPIQVARNGIATAVVSLPLKYMHTPHEVMDLRDGEAIAELVAAYIRRICEVQA